VNWGQKGRMTLDTAQQTRVTDGNSPDKVKWSPVISFCEPRVKGRTCEPLSRDDEPVSVHLSGIPYRHESLPVLRKSAQVLRR